jgi:hypothetical protein
MKQLRKYIWIFPILIIPVYLIVVQSTLRYKHTHILPDGTVISHSHLPVNETGNGTSHQHTKRELLFYSLVNIHLHNTTSTEVVDFRTTLIFEKFINTEVLSKSFSVFYHKVSRAPPTIS